MVGYIYCQTASIEMREEEARMEILDDQYMEEAENAERQAGWPGKRLKREAGPVNMNIE